MDTPLSMNSLQGATSDWFQARYIEAINEELQDVEANVAKWQALKEQYENLQLQLHEMPKKLTLDIMVPFGRFGFMPGKVIHTNEITVLLGDNWFVQRSAHQALEILGRRLAYVEGTIAKFKSEQTLLHDRMKFTTVMDHEDDTVEIREELTETKDSPHTTADTGAVELDLPGKPQQVSAADFAKLMARLDELEAMEEEDVSSEESTVSSDSDVQKPASSAHGSMKTGKKRVRFEKEPSDIKEKHLPMPAEPQLISNDDHGFSALPKSILKQSDVTNTSASDPLDSHCLQATQARKLQQDREAVHPVTHKNAFTGAIVEKADRSDVSSSSQENADRLPGQSKLVSKFRQSRQL